MFYTILLGLLFGLAKGFRDTISHHWDKSTLSLTKNLRLKLWLKSDWKNKPSHPFFFLWDGWHFSDSTIALSSGLLLLIMYQGSLLYLLPLVFLLSAGISFNLSYHGFLLQPQYRTWFWFIR